MSPQAEYERAREIAEAIPDTATAEVLLSEIQRRFGITLRWWNRADVEEAYGYPLTDAEWQEVQATRAWEDCYWVSDYDTVSEHCQYERWNWPAYDGERGEEAARDA